LHAFTPSVPMPMPHPLSLSPISTTIITRTRTHSSNSINHLCACAPDALTHSLATPPPPPTLLRPYLIDRSIMAASATSGLDPVQRSPASTALRLAARTGHWRAQDPQAKTTVRFSLQLRASFIFLFHCGLIGLRRAEWISLCVSESDSCCPSLRIAPSHTQTHTHAHTHARTHTHYHTHTHTHTHYHTHTYTHTHAQVDSAVGQG
jgi:hypothetical protein